MSCYYGRFVTCYDNYAFGGATNFTNLAYNTFWDGTFNHVKNTAIKGKMTATLTKVLQPATVTDSILCAVIYYDKYGNVIQTVADNHLGGIDRTVNDYDFAGKVLQSVRKHGTSGVDVPHTITQTYTYDHAARLLKTYHQINTGTNYLLAENTYNELGQLRHKKHSNTTGTPLQTSTYAYNERGWLTNMSSPLYNLTLWYNSSGPPVTGTPQYNGNIAFMSWSTAQGSRHYGFTYDGLNRLTNADFQQVLLKDYNSTRNDVCNMNWSYDLNGNIKTQQRWGDGTYGTGNTEKLDHMTYAYDGNKILTIADTCTDLTGRGDFTEPYANGTGDGREYNYDSNGNLIKNENNNQKFTYNILNLPDLMYYNTGSYPYIDYMYDATGTKRQEYYLYGPGNSKTIDYVGEFVYKKTGTAAGVLDFIITPEGRAKYNGSTFTYEYYLKDHLGNTAIVFKDSTGIAKVIQESHYYPFGLRMANTAVSNSTDNRYLYNGKELQSELGFGLYDYGARFYDAAVGRWWSIDPAAEKNLNLTPYNYAANSPIIYIDPNGETHYYFRDGTAAYYGGDNGDGKDRVKAYNVKIESSYTISCGDGNEILVNNVSIEESDLQGEVLQFNGKDVTHQEFQVVAAMAYDETYKREETNIDKFRIANTIVNRAMDRRKNDPDAIENTLARLAGGGIEHHQARYDRGKKDEGKEKKVSGLWGYYSYFKAFSNGTMESNRFMNVANAAAINALSKYGIDYSIGAIEWRAADKTSGIHNRYYKQYGDGKGNPRGRIQYNNDDF